MITADLDRSSQIVVDQHEIPPAVHLPSDRIGDGFDGTREARALSERDLDEIVVVGVLAKCSHVRITTQQTVFIGPDGEAGELVRRIVVASPCDETDNAEHCWLENDPIVEPGTTEVLVLEQAVAAVNESQHTDGAHGASLPASVRRDGRFACRHPGAIDRPHTGARVASSLESLRAPISPSRRLPTVEHPTMAG
ncbi:MAG: hypothetical protein U9R47_09895 [Actinomycetota bacterium]|nr:hypothetical protein [Actinomycetota bacterium]